MPDSTDDSVDARHALRRAMRQRRAALTDAALDASECRLADHLAPLLARCSRVAAYLAINGEMPLGLVLSRCRAHGARARRHGPLPRA